MNNNNISNYLAEKTLLAVEGYLIETHMDIDKETIRYLNDDDNYYGEVSDLIERILDKNFIEFVITNKYIKDSEIDDMMEYINEFAVTVDFDEECSNFKDIIYTCSYWVLKAYCEQLIQIVNNLYNDEASVNVVLK